MADEIVLRIHEAQFAELTRGKNGDVAKDLSKRAERLRLLAVRQVGKDTGKLAASMRVSKRYDPHGPVAYVGSDSRIALLHHNGTPPHPIAAKPGRMLRFSHRGKVVYARKVMHPGTRPNRYLTDNLRRVVVD